MISVLVVGTWSSVPAIGRGVWIAAGGLVAVARIAHTRTSLARLRDESCSPETLTRVAHALVMICVVGGLVLSVPLLLWHGRLSDVQQTVIIISLAGYAAGSVATLSAWQPAMLAYVAATLVPLIVTEVVQALSLRSLEHALIAGLGVALFALLNVAGRRLTVQLRQLFELDAERSSLLAQLEDANLRLRSERDEFEVQATIDSLTRLANRRTFDQQLDAEWRRCERDELPLSVALIDIDFFKPFNDTRGHAEGDRCLRRVARAISGSVHRPGDLAARYGGEEFVLVMPGSPMPGAAAVAVRVHASLADASIDHGASTISEFITVSIGVSSLVPTRDAQASELLKGADLALYAAKAAGRNTTVYADDAMLAEAREAILDAGDSTATMMSVGVA